MTIHQDSTSIDISTSLPRMAMTYRCESTEEKPTGALENELLIELDTGDIYYFSKSLQLWKKVGYLNE